MWYRILMMVAAVALTPALALGQPVEGDWEFTLGGNGSNDNEFEDGSFGLAGSAGYYWTDDLLIAVRQDVNYSDVSNEASWNGSTRVAVDYHFDMMDRDLRPFVGANIGALYGDDTEDTGIAGPEAGIKWYVKDETFIFGMAEYQFLFEEGDDIDDNFEDGRFVYTVGIGFNW